MSAARSAVGLAATTLLLGCALEAGGGFARLEPGGLEVELAPGAARRLEDGSMLTDLGYRVELTRCALSFERFELQTLRGAAAGAARFDPANPPEGFSACHGGHCHAADGTTPSYEEIQEQLSGGAARWETLASVDLRDPFDLVGGERRELSDYAPGAELPRAVLGRAALAVHGLRCEGVVRGPELIDSVRLELELTLDEHWSAPLDRSIDRDGPESLEPEVRVRVDGTLLDGLQFADLALDGRVRIDGADDATHAAAAESLAGATTLVVRLQTGKED